MLTIILLILVSILLIQICLLLTNIKIEMKYNNTLFEEQNEMLKNKDDE
jgi:hypothetical protein